ncbi:MAG: hypothetical protein LBT64_00550 [Puniceicoccales bacterium]|nr:hypothetical protein [Puniceicoccales bacterium]
MKLVRNFLLIFLLGCGLAATGCSSIIRNDTPRHLPQNSSEIYTLVMHVDNNGIYMMPNSCSARIIVDDEIHEMEHCNACGFAYDYKRPPDKFNSTYCYEIDYRTKVNGKVRNKFERSIPYNLFITNRYVVGFETNRGVPGATETLLGRGFEAEDRIEIGGITCKTAFVSPNSLSFIIPLTGRSGDHRARLVSNGGDIGLGDFRIDSLPLSVSADSISLAVGERMNFSVSVAVEAPEDGIQISVTTNIPDSIIMGDIVIPAGAKSASAAIHGGADGAGMLYISAGGFDELKIPIEVVASGAEVTVDPANDAVSGGDVVSDSVDSDYEKESTAEQSIPDEEDGDVVPDAIDWENENEFEK